MKSIIIVVCMAIACPAWATPERVVDWNTDEFSKFGTFFAGAMQGATIGADPSPRTIDEATAGAAMHIGISVALISMAGPVGLAYLGVSALFGGIARLNYKEAK